MKNSHNLKYTVITISLIAFATLISLLIQYFSFSEANIVVIYILSVLLVSRYTRGYVYGIIASILSMLTFNFLFTLPVYTFNVYDETYIFTFFVMLFAAIFTSALTSQIIKANVSVTQKEIQSRIMYQLANSLGQTNKISDIAATLVQKLSTLLDWTTCFFVINQENNSGDCFLLDPVYYTIQTIEADHTVFSDLNSKFTFYPIKVKEVAIAFLGVAKSKSLNTPEDHFLLDSIIIQASNALERVTLASEKETAFAETERERLKSSLLRAISHDIRTPLTGIAGASEILLHTVKEKEALDVVNGIYSEAIWLTQLVENILSLTRIQEGRDLKINRKTEAVEEIIAEAISRIKRYAPAYNIITEAPSEVLFVSMDGKLIEQVLINLIDNAIKHSASSNNIIIRYWDNCDFVYFEIEDHGSGIDRNALSNIFDLFNVSTKTHVDSKRGIGLGLAICKSIVQYHNGEIEGKINDSGGMTFRFSISKK